MSRTLTVTYDKSDEDTPVLCIVESNICSIAVINMFTGEKAEQIYKELTGKKRGAE